MRRLRYARWPLRAGAPCEDEYTLLLVHRSERNAARTAGMSCGSREKETEKEESWRKKKGKRKKEKESKSDAEIDEKKGEEGDREGRDE